MASVSSQRKRATIGVKAGGGKEQAYWFFLRVSGLALVVLAGLHLFITHYANVPSETVFDFVANRWENPLWRTFDLLLLFSAMWHGLIGVRMILRDFFHGAARAVVTAILWAFGVAFTALGLVNIVAFERDIASTNTGPLADQMWIGDTIGYSLYVIAAVMYIAVILLIIWVVRTLQAGQVPIYKGDVGQYAWALHRLTGAGIFAFLLIHILDIMLVGLGRDLYDHTVGFYANAFIVPMEIMLVGAVIYHTLNGIRVCMVNFSSSGPVREKSAFWGVLIATVVLTLPSAIIILMNEF